MGDLSWVAIYDDNTVLKQFNPDRSENLFGDIKLEKLKEFSFITPTKNLSVFPKTGKYGIFSIMGSDIAETRVAVGFTFDTINTAELFRLVYFKRVKRELGQGNNSTANSEIYYIGLQATIDGVNHVRLLSYDNGTISIVDKK